MQYVRLWWMQEPRLLRLTRLSKPEKQIPKVRKLHSRLCVPEDRHYFFVKFLTTPQFHISLKCLRSAHKIYSLPSFFSRGFNLLKSLQVNIFLEMQHFPGYDSTVKETYVINGTQEEGLRLTI